MKKLTHFSLFSGIGGIDIAAEWAGFETVGQCEFADFPTKVLEKHWPDVPRWRDVRDVTIKSIRDRGIEEITVLSGGFPCQPHSLMGKRKASDDERDLWPEYRRIIGEARPRWVLAENVPGLLSSEDGRFFRGILRDFAELGYDVGWCTVRASWVGAIHRRERIFIVAHNNSIRKECDFKEPLCWEQNIPSGEDIGRIEDLRIGPVQFEPKLCRAISRFPKGMDRLKCLGNAVVPQQVYPILKAIADIEKGEQTG